MLFFDKLKKNNKVDFLIIGAQKCGTTSLFEYLKFHPQLKGPFIKEVNYFNNHYNYNSGIKWYHSKWKEFPSKKYFYYEATPGYFYYPFCPERIASYNPKMKFIYMVRDPIKRAYSSYNMYKQIVNDPTTKTSVIKEYFTNRNPEIEVFFQKMFNNPLGFPTFEEYINEEMDIINKHDNLHPEPSFIRRGLYMEQLTRFYQFFPKSSFFCIEQNELKNEPVRILNELCSFIGAEHIDWKTHPVETQHHVREYDDTINEDLLELLKKFYSYPNNQFYSHIGKRFNWY